MSVEHVVLVSELSKTYGVSMDAFLSLDNNCTLQKVIDLVVATSGLSNARAYREIIEIMEAKMILNVDASKVSPDSRLISDLCFGVFD